MDNNDIISRSAAIAKFQGQKAKSKTILDACLFDVVISMISDVPAVDPEELKGRCRTCRYSLPISEDRNYPHIFCDQHDVYMTQDDFCSRYEARGE